MASDESSDDTEIHETVPVPDGGTESATAGQSKDPGDGPNAAISFDVPDGAEIDAEDMQRRLNERTGSNKAVAQVQASGSAGGDTGVTPVSSGVNYDISKASLNLSEYEISGVTDPQILNIQENTVRYNERVGDWLLSNDDLIPGIIARLKGLLMGESGLSVDPDNPDDDADVRKAEHMRAIYNGGDEAEVRVKPADIVDTILTENLRSSVWVGRSTDLEHVDVSTLRYAKSGDTGEEVYIQSPTGYTTFDIDEDGSIELQREQTDKDRALEIGKHVFDLRLFRTPPLKSIANDVLNKIQLKRLKGRKAEIASVGGIVISVKPPEWLDQNEWNDTVPPEDNPYATDDGDSIKRLELVYQREMKAALETLEDYQTATVMSIPDNWEIDTIDLPEMDESFDDMIRGYNQAISRRLLFPLDLLELSKGSELSRGSMMETMSITISGWQGDIVEVFEDFAEVQGDINGMSGSVTHSLPALSAEDEEQIIQLLNFAGIMDLSEAEIRTMANKIEGVDLDEDPEPAVDQDMPPEGGPADKGDRRQSMQERLDRQGSEPGVGDQSGQKNPEAGTQQTATPESTRQATASITAKRVESPNLREAARDIRNQIEDGTGTAQVAEMTKAEPGVYTVTLKNRQGKIERSVRITKNNEGGFTVSGYTSMLAGAPLDPVEAASYSELDPVEYGDGNFGMVLDIIKSDFDHPEEDQKIKASSDQPVYVVARESGGSGFFRDNELSSGSWPDDIPGDVTGGVEAIKAKFPSPVPEDADVPYSDMREQYGDDGQKIEALGVPGVEDPEVGFRPGEPDGWNRLSYLRAYASVGGSFSSCVDEMRGDVSRPKQWCAALKDEVYGTEDWRGGWT